MIKRLVRSTWSLALLISWREFWVGIRVDRRYCMGPEVYTGRGTKTRRTKAGGYYQLESIDISLNLVPGVTISWRRWWR